MRGGLRLSGTFKGLEPVLLGVDVGAVLHDSGDGGRVLGAYAMMYMRLGD